MTRPEQEAREMLAACPACGSPPTRNGRVGVGGVLCVSLDGDHRFQVYGADQAEADAAWNAFAARPTAGIDHKELIAELTAQAWKEEPGQTMHLTASFRAAYALTLADARIAELESVRRGDIGMAITEAEAPAKTGERGAVIEEIRK